VTDCDRIKYMEHGRVVEQGTHEELLAMRGRYYAMAERQLHLDRAGRAGARSVPQENLDLPLMLLPEPRA